MELNSISLWVGVGGRGDISWPSISIDRWLGMAAAAKVFIFFRFMAWHGLKSVKNLPNHKEGAATDCPD